MLRLGSREVVDVRIAPVPSGSSSIYFLLASVGIFTLLVGGSVRLRRPRDQATLHFFWLAVAFFGVFTFSFSGRLDRLDWVFYWGDVVALLLLPPLFLHFALVVPGAAPAPGRPYADRVRAVTAALLPAGGCCWAACARPSSCDRRGSFSGTGGAVLHRRARDHRSHRAGVVLAAGLLVAGLAIMVTRALRRSPLDDGAAPVAVDCVGGTVIGGVAVRWPATGCRGRPASMPSPQLGLS